MSCVCRYTTQWHVITNYEEHVIGSIKWTHRHTGVPGCIGWRHVFWISSNSHHAASLRVGQLSTGNPSNPLILKRPLTCGDPHSVRDFWRWDILESSRRWAFVREDPLSRTTLMSHHTTRSSEKKAFSETTAVDMNDGCFQCANYTLHRTPSTMRTSQKQILQFGESESNYPINCKPRDEVRRLNLLKKWFNVTGVRIIARKCLCSVDDQVFVHISSDSLIFALRNNSGQGRRFLLGGRHLLYGLIRDRTNSYFSEQPDYTRHPEQQHCF